MQVDEEVKGQSTTGGKPDLEVGGYEDDSEDEREIKECEESQKDIILTFNEAGTAQVATVGTNPSTLVVCGCLHSQSLVKIMYGADWQEIGEVTSKKTSTKNDETSAKDKEPKSILKLYAMNAATPFYFALPDMEKFSSGNQVVNQIFG